MAHKAHLARDFVVLVRETVYDGSQYLTKTENINVLVGKQPAIDGAKAVIEKFLKEFNGTF